MFIKRFQIARVFGFPVYIDVSWFLIAIALSWMLAAVTFPQLYPGHDTGTYWVMGIVGTLGLFLSVLLHEFGHALVAQRFGIEMRGITLFIFGGVAEMADEPPSATAELLVAIAGPIVSVAIAGAMFGVTLVAPLTGLPGSMTAVASYLALLNTILVVFNMVPAFPLDGGRVLRAILWHFKGNLRWATRITSSIGSGFGLLLIVLGVFAFFTGQIFSGVWLFIIGMFLRNAANMSYQQLLVRRALEGEPVRRFMNARPITVRSSLTLRELVDDYVYQHYHKLYPVVDNGHVSGCVTTSQIKSVPQEQWDTTRVADVANGCTAENTISVDADAMSALSRMSQGNLSRLMVVDRGELVGIISLKDLLGFLSLKVELEEQRESGRDVDDIMAQRSEPRA